MKPLSLAGALKNWKTTLSGILAAIGSWYAFYPSDFVHLPWLVHLAKVFQVGGLVGLGLTARDLPAKDESGSGG